MNYLVGSIIPGESFHLNINPGEADSIDIFFSELLVDTNSRGIIFPKLIVLPNYILNNFDSSNIFYFSWIILSLTLFMFFLIIRKINGKLYLLLVPIAAILFSPLINSNYWNYSTLIWTLPALAIVSTVYLLNKKQNFKNISGIILLSFFATFSIPTALTIWLVGIITIIRKIIRKKISPYRLPLTYFISMLIIGISYFLVNTLNEGLLTQSTIPIKKFFSIESFYVIMTLLAVPFKLNSSSLGIGNIFYIITGTISLLIAISLTYYLGIIRKKFDEIFPWVLFLIISLSGAILIRLGRFDSYFTGEFAYYSPIIGFFQIGVAALVIMTILDIREQRIVKRKQFVMYFLISIVILQMFLLIPSYYVGWWKADYYYNEKMDYLKCFSIYNNWNDCEMLYESRHNDKKISNNFIIINFFLENNFNIFSNDKLNKNTIQELEKFYNEYKKADSIMVIEGNISSINNIKTADKERITIKDDVVIVSGYISNVFNDIQTVYLIADETPIAKFDNFDMNEKEHQSLDTEIFWKFAILENYFPDNCKKISIAGMKDNGPFVLNHELELCS
tara:strand:- start:59 stop:1747 length:1689 start_codon:yes stop_codon:yes gene_type:complete